MSRKHIITISGKPGSGKSSTANRVANLLGYKRYSSGDFVRNIVRKHNITLADFNNQAGKDPAIDHEIDEELRLLRNENDIVIDSRLGFYWIPESFKVYLELDLAVATARIYRDMLKNSNRSDIEKGESISGVRVMVETRLANERKRFSDLYGINPYNTSTFDLVINTSRHSPQTVALTIYDFYNKWLNQETWNRVVSEVPLGYSFSK